MGVTTYGLSQELPCCTDGSKNTHEWRHLETYEHSERKPGISYPTLIRTGQFYCVRCLAVEKRYL